jgi:uncharacterized repeat protein (TIGR01451 family)
MISVRSMAAFVAAWVLGAPLAHALGTPAGTTIQSTAEVTYVIGGSTLSTTSNVASIPVDEIIDVTLAIAAPSVTAAPGASSQELLFTVANVGNGNEAFSLQGLSAGIAGDEFDPVLSATSLYFDTDSSGDLSAPDVAYVPGTNDPVLAPDATVRILLVNDIPLAVSNGARGRSELTVRSLTATGAAGSTFDNAGDGGVDVVLGASGGDASLQGEYVVEALLLSAVKSQSIRDTAGGSRVQPGSRIDYRVVVTMQGGGTATAATFDDLIPASTTYVAGSLRLNSASLSDDTDGDAGEYATTPARVRVNLGDLTSASGPQTIEFAVTID